MIQFKTTQMLFKARNNLLPENIRKLFTEREGGYSLREELNFKIHHARTTLKSLCLSISGVKLWNSLTDELKKSKTIGILKRIFKTQLLN